MEKRIKSLEEMVGRVDAKLSELLSIQKNNEADKQATIKLQIQLEQMRIDHEYEMRNDAWNREDEIRAENKKDDAEKRDIERYNRIEEREHERELAHINKKK